MYGNFLLWGGDSGQKVNFVFAKFCLSKNLCFQRAAELSNYLHLSLTGDLFLKKKGNSSHT